MRWKDEVHRIIPITKIKGGTTEITSCAFAMVIYKLWQARNNAQFQILYLDLLIKAIVIHLHVVY